MKKQMRKLKLSVLCILMTTLLLPNSYSQSSLKFESGGGPTGSGPTEAAQTVTMYKGDGAVHSPSTTVTYSLSNQQYAIDGASGYHGIMFGGADNTGGNTPSATPLYQLMNSISSPTNDMYSTDGATPALNITNDYGIQLFVCADALINPDGTDKVGTNVKNLLFGRLTLTFNRPVTNPVIHITGMGATVLFSLGNQLGMSTGFKIVGTNTITELGGNIAFKADNATGKIFNQAVIYGASSAVTSASKAASGSFRVNGTNITSVALDVYISGDGTAQTWATTSTVGGDGLFVSVSLTTYNLSGKVTNDNNGMTEGVNGTNYSGATVTLYASNGTTALATTTTDASGNYSFADQQAGDYVVGVTLPSGYNHVSATDGTPTDGKTAVTIGSSNVNGIDFGINQKPTATNDNLNNQTPGSTVTVSNILSNDTDPNGGTLSAANISLIAPNGATGTVTNNGLTTSFTVPNEGTWTLNTSTGAITFTPQSGFTADPTPIKYTVTDNAGLTSNEATITIDYNSTVSISGTVYDDNNAGTPDGTVFPNVGVTLKKDGVSVGSSTTDASGNYSFNNLVPGNYTVVLSVGGGYNNVGSTDATPLDGSTNVTVSGSNVTGINFGLNLAPTTVNDALGGQTPGTVATVPNILANDTDPNSGTLSAGKIGITTQLTATNQIIDAAGRLTSFTVPGEGTWALNSSNGNVTFTPQAGFTGDPTEIYYRVTDEAGLISNWGKVTVDYNPLATLSGTIYDDNNAGTPDGTALSGVTVTLFNNGSSVSTTTDANGNYNFSNITPNWYYVSVSAPSGYNHVSSTDASPTDGYHLVYVGSSNITGINFGLNNNPTATNDDLNNQTPGSTATVSNILSNDSDPNSGTLAKDSISLVAPSGATAITTDAQGDVTGFTVPNEGAWALNSSTGAVTFTPQSGFTADPTPIKYTVTDNAGLTSNQATISIDYNPLATLSGTIYDDNNAGTPDGTTLSGVTVTLYNNGTSVSTTTDASGNYSFSNIIPNYYYVSVSTPSGYNRVSSTDASPTDVNHLMYVGSSNITGVNFGLNKAPVAANDSLNNQTPGNAATVSNILSNDSDPNSGTLAKDSISLVAPSGATGITTDAQGDVTGFTVPNEGTWALNSSTGAVTFTPQAGFTADPTPIKWHLIGRLDKLYYQVKSSQIEGFYFVKEIYIFTKKGINTVKWKQLQTFLKKYVRDYQIHYLHHLL
ncbi:hypothetical protein DBR32_03290 [Taibaiella sp. KBW10]|uniref:beta strand repeat-containing protein n=1 Tax=Taibaiella sp. KBW10 TaxID=2153357 RepID=UPI000F59EA51|nr:SdrD B-like domain-containing protein [Taibaiella sp. KBW10]RQO32630.1 hypothetical protein DBR32_03290 [Taibaiella sp. KBW10]